MLIDYLINELPCCTVRAKVLAVNQNLFLYQIKSYFYNWIKVYFCIAAKRIWIVTTRNLYSWLVMQFYTWFNPIWHCFSEYEFQSGIRITLLHFKPCRPRGKQLTPVILTNWIHREVYTFGSTPSKLQTLIFVKSFAEAYFLKSRNCNIFAFLI